MRKQSSKRGIDVRRRPYKQRVGMRLPEERPVVDRRTREGRGVVKKGYSRQSVPALSVGCADTFTKPPSYEQRWCQ